MKLAHVLVPVAAIALLAGCATPSGGTAFSVNGVDTSLSRVDEVAKSCVAISHGELKLADVKTTATQMLLVGRATEAISKATGTTVSAAERDAEIAKQQAGGFAKDSNCAAAITGFIDYTVLLGKLGAPKMVTEMKKLDVQVNPRFGAWRPEKASFTNDSGSLSRESLGLGKVYGG